MKKLFLFITLIVITISLKAQYEDYFTFTPLKPRVNETVTFTANPPYGPDDIFIWHFWDDESIVHGTTVTHKFTLAGQNIFEFQGMGYYITIYPSTSIEEYSDTIDYNYEYEVYDVTGRFIGNNIDVLKNGIYFIKQKIDNKYCSKKIVIMR